MSTLLSRESGNGVRWLIILAGDINESYFWNTQIIAPGGTSEAGSSGDKYCYSINCVNGKFPAPNSGPGGSPTPVAPDTHAAIFVDKAVNFSVCRRLNQAAEVHGGYPGIQWKHQYDSKLLFLGFSLGPGWQIERRGHCGRRRTAYYSDGFSSWQRNRGSGSKHRLDDAAPRCDPGDINLKNGGFLPYVLLPQDYASGSNEPSRFVPGVKRGQFEVVNIGGFGGDGKLYI